MSYRGDCLGFKSAWLSCIPVFSPYLMRSWHHLNNFLPFPSRCLVNLTLFNSKHLFSSSIPSCLTSLRPSLFLPYQMGHFMYAAKAFDVLERLDPEPEYWEGKRGACVGVFQLMIAGKASRDDLQDVLTMVRNTSNPQVEYIVRIIQKWCKDNNIKIT